MAQIFTRSFNDDGRSDDVRRQAKTMRRLHTLQTPRLRRAERRRRAWYATLALLLIHIQVKEENLGTGSSSGDGTQGAVLKP